MKVIILLLLAVFSFGSLHAQFDSPTTTTSGNLLNSNEINTSTRRTAPSLSKRNYNFYKRPEQATLDEKEEKVDISENEGFIEPEIDFNPKYAQKPGNERKMSEEYKQNQYLGDFKTKSGEIKIICRDHQAVDGDLVRVYQDGEVVADKIYLEARYKTIYMKLKEGFNKIEVEALNQGQSGPNTAQFQVLDESGNVITSNEWNLATGYKASFIVVKTP